MDEFLKSMGMRILLRRKELGLTQEDVAELAGVTPQTISTAERGEKALRPENIVKVCVALETTPDYLLLGEAASVSPDKLPIRIARLTPLQRSYLNRIVDNFLEALAVTECDN